MSGRRIGGPLRDGVEYRPIPGYPGYVAGDDGTIFSTLPCPGRPPVRELVQNIDHQGYPTVRVSPTPGARVTRRKVPRLIALAFHGPRPENLQIRHLDGNPGNNTPANLKYGTAAENAADRTLHGTQVRGESCHGAFIRDAEVRAAVKRVIDGELMIDVARDLGIGKGLVQDWCRGVRADATAGLDLSSIPKNRRAAGDRSRLSKVSDAEIRDMKSLAASGVKLVDIASVYDVHPASVSRFVRGVWRSAA